MPEAERTLSDVLAETARRLKEKLGEDGTREREAALLVEAATGFGRLAQMSDGQRAVGADALHTLETMVGRRLRGESVYRVIGRRPFYGLDLEMSAETLEPRDDTEVLVDAVLARLSDRDTAWRIADLGTGTGAIGLALASVLPAAGVTLTDVSAGALDTARRNALAHGLLDRVALLEGSWCEPLEGMFDVIVSNPPYIVSAIIETLATEVRDHDPRRALDGGADGLDAYRLILEGSADRLTKDGFLALEIGYDQAEPVSNLAKPDWAVSDLIRDLGGRDRVLILTRRD